MPSDEKRTPLTKWMPRMAVDQLGPGWVRHYDGAIIYESEVLDLMNDEALSALLREKRRRRA